MVTIPSLRTIPRALKLGKKNHLKKGAKLGKKGANLEASPDGDGDFALLQLVYPVTKQRYICLLSPGNIYISTQAITAGWGLDETGRTPDIPRHVGLETITNQECQGKYVRTIIDNMICATYKGQGEFASVCPGDSGSPLMVGDTIIGVASIAQTCKPIVKGRLTHFARVTSQVPWIKQYVTDACSGSN